MATLTLPPRVSSAPTLVQLHNGLWRVLRSSGSVLGYIDRVPDERGERFRAKRLTADKRGFLPLGEFWRLQDAIDCLRFA
jgi:predicted methyltransferase